MDLWSNTSETKDERIKRNQSDPEAGNFIVADRAGGKGGKGGKKAPDSLVFFKFFEFSFKKLFIFLGFCG